MTKAIIFDMDGLMIDSERVTWEGYQSICPKYGYEMDYRFYQTLLGYPMTTIRRRFREHFGDAFPMEKIIREVHSYMAERFEKEGVPKKKGLTEILNFVKEKGFQAAVATSSDRVRVAAILKQAGIEGYFQGVVCGDEVEKGKPDPEVFQKCCEKLKVRPEEAWVIEDSQMGILAASRAGIRCICVPDLIQPEETYRRLAYQVADSLKEAISIIEAYERKRAQI